MEPKISIHYLRYILCVRPSSICHSFQVIRAAVGVSPKGITFLQTFLNIGDAATREQTNEHTYTYCNKVITFLQTFLNIGDAAAREQTNEHTYTYCNKVTNGCNSLFCVFISFSTLHVSGSHKPIIRGISSCFFIYNHLVHVLFMLLICVCLWTGLSWW